MTETLWEARCNELISEIDDADAIGRMSGWVERQAGTEGDRLFLLSHPP